MIYCAWHAWLCRSHEHSCLTMPTNLPRSAIRNRPCWPVCARKHIFAETIGGRRRCWSVHSNAGRRGAADGARSLHPVGVRPLQSQTAPAGACADRNRSLVRARNAPSVPHGGRGFTRLCACSRQPLVSTRGRQTPPDPDLAEVVGRGLDGPPGGEWTDRRSGAPRGPCGVSPPGGTNPGPAALHTRWLREDLGIESIIPPVAGRPARGLTRRPSRRHLQLAFPHQASGQQWKVETFISVVKRRFGRAVTVRSYWQQVKQTLLRGITYTLYRAVQLGLSGHLRSHRLFKAAA
jgi:hypothetical protein